MSASKEASAGAVPANDMPANNVTACDSHANKMLNDSDTAEEAATTKTPANEGKTETNATKPTNPNYLHLPASFENRPADFVSLPCSLAPSIH